MYRERRAADLGSYIAPQAQSERDIAYAESGMQTQVDETEPYSLMQTEVEVRPASPKPLMISMAVQSDPTPTAPIIVVQKLDLNELRAEAVKRFNAFWHSSNRTQVVLTVAGLAWAIHSTLSESDDAWVNRTDTFMNPAGYVAAFGS